MSAKKKAPLLKWWSAAKGQGDDLTYYNNSRGMARIVQGMIIVFGILITAVKAIAFLLIYSASLSVLAKPAVDNPFFLNDNAALLGLWREFIPMLGVLLGTVVFVMVVEKKSIRVSIVRNPVRNISYGLALGCLLLGVSLLFLVLMGYINVGEKNTIPYIWVWFISIILNAVTQEYLVRGYLFSLFKEAFNAAASVIITTVIFTAMHGSAFEAGIIAVLNVMTMSVLASLLLLYTESLLAPIIVHILWNGIGGIVFGVVSLDGGYPSLWNSVMSGNELISGGSAKLDGSIIALSVNVLLIALILFKLRRTHTISRQHELPTKYCHSGDADSDDNDN
jgi:membrane protease YdiL (CAAX protease family)